MFKFIGKSILTLCFLSFVGAIAIFFYYTNQIEKPLVFSEEAIYSITPGQSIRHLARKLVEDGVLQEPFSLQLLSRTKFSNQHIKTGDYQFTQGMTSVELMEQIIAGKVLQFKVTILEGWTFQQFLNALEKSENIDHQLSDLSTDEILTLLNFEGEDPEGWFYPDTYIYTRSDSDIDVLKRAYIRMQEELDAAWQNRDVEATSNLQTPYDALKLASIIERETSIGEERTIVSSVFHNRLNKKMLLQTDPTIIYGLGDAFDGNLTKAHLKDDKNSYNTYVYPGLTPTPISLPSKTAIEAALNPETTDFVYFVATGNGGHKFTKTYDEHRKAIREYLRVLSQQKEQKEDE